MVTDDFSLKVRVEANFGIETFELPEGLRLKPEQDFLEKENIELKRKLASYENKAPRLLVEFSSGRPHLDISVPDIDFGKYVNRKIRDAKFAHPHVPVNKSERSFLDQQRLGSLPPKESDIIQYNCQLDQYYINLERFYQNNYELIASKLLTHQVQFSLRNSGTVPALEIEAVLQFPSDVTVHDPEDSLFQPEESKPEPPDIPINPIVNLAGFSQNRQGFIFPEAVPKVFPIPNMEESLGINESGTEVKLYKAKLKHNDTHTFGDPVLISFPDFHIKSGFSINYEIRVDNVPSLISGKLTVGLKKNPMDRGFAIKL